MQRPTLLRLKNWLINTACTIINEPTRDTLERLVNHVVSHIIEETFFSRNLVVLFFFFIFHFSFLRRIQGLFSRWGDSLQSNDHVSRYRWFIATHWNHVRVFPRLNYCWPPLKSRFSYPRNRGYDTESYFFFSFYDLLSIHYFVNG